MRFSRIHVVAAIALATLWQPTPAGAITPVHTTRPAIWRDGTWYLRNTLNDGTADASFGFGNAEGDFPMMCDWDGNGTKTPGVWRSGHWFVTNAIPPTNVIDF